MGRKCLQCVDRKRQLKFLQQCTSSKVIKAILQSAPDNVIKIICNAALNAQKGSVYLSRKEKFIFKKHRLIFRQLIDERISLQRKRNLLINAHRDGGILLIPILLKCVHRTFGTVLYSKRRMK
jgi:hypothetical protein